MRYFVKEITTKAGKTSRRNCENKNCRVLKLGRQALRSRGWRLREKAGSRSRATDQYLFTWIGLSLTAPWRFEPSLYSKKITHIVGC